MGDFLYMWQILLEIIGGMVASVFAVAAGHDVYTYAAKKMKDRGMLLPKNVKRLEE